MFVFFLISPDPAQKKIRISCTVLTGPKWECVVSSVPDPSLVKLRNPKSSKVSVLRFSAPNSERLFRSECRSASPVVIKCAFKINLK